MAYQAGIEDNNERNEVMIAILQSKLEEGKQGLLIINTLIHGEELLYLTQKHGIKKTIFLQGSSSEEERIEAIENFKDRRVSCIIVTKIFDEGIDISNINFVILGAGGKSSYQFLQRIGRGIREKKDGSSLEVYDFQDLHNHYLRKHSEERLQICVKEDCFEIIDFKI